MSTDRHHASRAAISAPPPRPRPGLRLDHRTLPQGLVELPARPHHLLKMHAGAPTAGCCGAHLPFVYTRGDLDLLPAGASEQLETRDPSSALELAIPPTLLRHAAEDMGLDPDRITLAPRFQFRDPQLEHLVWALDAAGAAGHPSGRLYTDSLGLALAVHLLGQYPASDGPAAAGRRGLTASQLRRVVDFIEAHLDRDLSLARLARVAGVSASHFKTLFRRSTGVPVHEYVVQRRVARARTLLIEGRLPASQVALEAGFAHQSHMARHMRRRLGVTPKALARVRE